eukprot:TRINITY_DN6480_c0_g1_i1.p1 TRINITY_DN6480_c0_g1~~TRINITY_DN6480_c0_g1_i1.p1  ORF type:complete len:166 (-),score=7.80 TRINITY_DN6480_c0_g1_i1:58-555(-)
MSEQMGHSYKYNECHKESPPRYEEKERPNACSTLCGCGGLDLEGKMTRYIAVIAFFFAALLGPYSGTQAVAASQEKDYYMTATLTVVFFLMSLILAVKPSLRGLSRLWLMSGFAWVICGWVTYFRKDFTEKPEIWLTISVVQTCLFGVFGVPIFITDPMAINIFT